MLKTNPIRKTYLLFGLVIISIIFHNVFYAIFEIEEPVFFILAFVFIFAFVIFVVYNTVTYIRRGEPKDLWRLGWIGLLGLLGLIPGFSYGFFGFFGFFGARAWKQIKNN